MRRWLSCLLVAGCGLSVWTDFSRAVEPQTRRYARGSYQQFYVRKRQGQPVVSQVYNGYGQRYQPPAFLYYGYPHSGDGSGIGPLDRK